MYNYISYANGGKIDNRIFIFFDKWNLIITYLLKILD